MLSKFIMRAAISAAALSGTAGFASAEQYHVLMMDYAFFPEISYVEPGDIVVFENISGNTRTIAADDGSWVVQGLANGATATLTIEENMPNQYLSLVPGGPEDEVNEDGNVQVVGTLNFSGNPALNDN
ncbi:hypothetical protein OS189_11940 [Sulfitobacter sp. F26169L]|uniref:hypothetical protein n=1 Tax=Sulfitobacter sp. F26169L TaxID=2996015 RepID=UPI002260C1DD|nr:hypothetical protein [Sulfitobacter sp. F26169L]MCX7567053.1 hypothetical protein [Sulfitobacter sp. F26169L]